MLKATDQPRFLCSKSLFHSTSCSTYLFHSTSCSTSLFQSTSCSSKDCTISNKNLQEILGFFHVIRVVDILLAKCKIDFLPVFTISMQRQFMFTCIVETYIDLLLFYHSSFLISIMEIQQNTLKPTRNFSPSFYLQNVVPYFIFNQLNVMLKFECWYV